MAKDVLCVILGGGRGTRLYPLTKDRAKPAVPLFGKYRLIDIPISNCIHSGFHKIKILTQFNSESLNNHIARTYKFDAFSGGFVEIVAADQTMEDTGWFQGTADAVRKSLRHFTDPHIKYVCILSGDQLYKMDLVDFLRYHKEKDAQITIACNIISESEISSFGIIGADQQWRVSAFVEKPEIVSAVKKLSLAERPGHYLCSMGIYVFDVEVLRAILRQTAKSDFGKEIIPEALQTHRAFAYPFDGYWRDIGSIRSFYEENLRMTEANPPLDLYDEEWPIFTRSRSLPPARYPSATIENSIVAEGSIVDRARIRHSMIGLRSYVGQGSVIEDTVVMGFDYYEAALPIGRGVGRGLGRNCVIKGAILDKNVRVGDGSKIVNAGKLDSAQGDNYTIKDGIVIVHKNAVLEPGTVI